MYKIFISTNLFILAFASLVSFAASNQENISVNFSETMDLQPQEAIECLDLNDSPTTFVLWYIGRKGLTKKSQIFYRDNIFAQAKPNFSYCLHDLYAWQCLKGEEGFAREDSPFIEIIRNLDGDKFFAESSCEFFESLSNSNQWAEESRELLQYTTLNLLSEIDFSQQDSNKTFDELVAISWLDEKFKQTDSQRTYSSLQFLEAIWITKKMVGRALFNNNLETNVVFFLPNDELKYYPQDMMRETMIDVLGKEFADVPDLRISITFATFKYTEKPKRRPYLDGKRVKNAQILTRADQFGKDEAQK